MLLSLMVAVTLLNLSPTLMPQFPLGLLLACPQTRSLSVSLRECFSCIFSNKVLIRFCRYGYIQVSSASSLIQRRSLPLLPHKRSKGTKKASGVTVTNESGGTTDGQVMWYGLLDQGALTLSDGEYVGAGGFTRHWDSCSSTVSPPPLLYGGVPLTHRQLALAQVF